MPLTTLLVDDEPLAREGLRLLLSGDAEVTAIYEARDGREAVAAIRSLRPNLVFLDVQMPEMDGFQVVSEIGAEHMPAIVFVTAHDEHAIQAFEINAIDYFLKPVSRERFAKALARAKARIGSMPADETSRRIVSLLEALAAPSRYLKRLAVRSAGKTIFVDLKDVDWIEAAENYAQFARGALGTPGARGDEYARKVARSGDVPPRPPLGDREYRQDSRVASRLARRIRAYAGGRRPAPIQPHLPREVKGTRGQSLLRR